MGLYGTKAYLIDDIKKEWETVKKNELFLRAFRLALGDPIDDLEEFVSLMDDFYYNGMVDGKPVDNAVSFVVYLEENY